MMGERGGTAVPARMSQHKTPEYRLVGGYPGVLVAEALYLI